MTRNRSWSLRPAPSRYLSPIVDIVAQYSSLIVGCVAICFSMVGLSGVFAGPWTTTFDGAFQKRLHHGYAYRRANRGSVHAKVGAVCVEAPVRICAGVISDDRPYSVILGESLRSVPALGGFHSTFSRIIHLLK